MKQIKLTQSKFALVDDSDYEEFNKYNWHYLSTGYAVRWPGIYMHREILRTSRGQQVDHRDMNRLNNQKSNLRIVTRSQNRINSRLMKDNKSGYKGVVWRERQHRWEANICFKGIRKYLGHFLTKEEAAHAYNEAALKYHDGYARLNNV